MIATLLAPATDATDESDDLAHLASDVPQRAVCGVLLRNVEAPDDHPRCPDCLAMRRLRRL